MGGGRSISAALLAAALFGAAETARAADDATPTRDRFDIAFGVTVTSDYISDGVTQTDHGPAIQSFFEPRIGIFYAGVWASNVSFEGDADTEAQFYAGLRPELGPASFEFALLHGTDLHDADESWNEFDASVEFEPGEALTVGAGVAYVFESRDITPEVSLAIALPHDFELSGRLAQVIYDDPSLVDYLTWDAGVSWTWNDAVVFDLRYHDSVLSRSECATNNRVDDACGGRVIVSISVDTSFSALNRED